MNEDKAKKIIERDTVGKISTELLEKSSDTHTVEEQMREQLSAYEDGISQCVEAHKKIFDGDFYVVVITKKEPLLPNVIRHYFFGRHSCPTPDYDQTVYKYNRKLDTINFVWVVPSKMACLYMKKYQTSVPKEEWGLLRYVLDFEDGTLFKMSKELNGEKLESPELAK